MLTRAIKKSHGWGFICLRFGVFNLIQMRWKLALRIYSHL